MITAIIIILGATFIVSVLSSLGLIAFNTAKLSGNIVFGGIEHFFDYVIAKCDAYIKKHYTCK